MPNPLLVLPDVELAVIQYLRLRPELTALVNGASIVTALPPSPAYPYVLVNSAGSGGEQPRVGLDDAAIQIDVVSNADTGKQIANQIARTVRAAIVAIANDVVPAGCLASGWVELAPEWLPDEVPTPPVARYTARYRIYSHP